MNSLKQKNVEERTRDCCNTLGWFVNSGEMPIELGDSWFSAKIITVMHLQNIHYR